MKITIDISSVLYGTGVSVYTEMLVKNLINLDKINSYTLFGGSFRRFTELKTIANKFNEKSKNVDNKIFPFPPTMADILWNKLHLAPIELFCGSTDIFHSSDWTQPPSKSFKVTTIHDLTPILYPEYSIPKIVNVHKRRLSWIKKEVNRIIVPSETTKKDLIRLNYNGENIKVIPEAVDPLFIAMIESVRSKRKRLSIYGKYLLAIGVNKRKNITRIIEAFKKVRNDLGYNLVIVGYQYEKLSKSDGVYFTGHVSQQNLADLYSNAQVLVYPSLYEGFGLPILEAFSAGIPVVTSNIGSMSELSQKAAILVDPYEVDSIAQGILKAQNNREILIKEGYEVSAKYSWEATAVSTLKIYNELVK